MPDSPPAQTESRSRRLQFRAGLLGVCLLAFLIGAIGITNEGDLSMHGDPARHLMNGVYFFDLARDRPFATLSDLIEYTRLYYARYPALGLGHLPLLLPIAEAPMFAIVGVSVMSARLVVLLSTVAAVAYLYLLVSQMYGVRAAVFAAAFTATSPLVVVLTRSVMSEMPTIALLVASAYYFQRFCATERRAPLAAFVVTVVLSLYAKQLAVFVFPAFLGTALVELGIRRLFKRDVVIAMGTIAVFSLPVIPLTLMMSPLNVEFVRVRAEAHYSLVSSILTAILPQLSVGVLLLAAGGLAMAAVKRDRRAVLFALWVGGVLAGLLIAGVLAPARYTIYWVPALSALAATMAVRARSGVTSRVLLTMLLLALGWQTWIAAQQRLVGAIGYEEAARFVVESDPGPTALFSGDIDTGYFSFFVRKHDPARRLVVLRSDKILTTSKLGRPSVENRIDRPEEIYRLLHTFGTRYVIIEDRASRSEVLEWLRQELRSSRFVERKRIPIGTTDIRMPGTSLVIYEFVDRTPPAPDAVLDMHLPIIGQSVSVKLSDLIARKYLR